MKCSLVKYSLVIFLILLNVCNSNRALFIENDAKFYAKFAKDVNCAQKPLAKSCPKCLNPGDGYKFYFYFQTTRLKKFDYKILMHYNDNEKKMIISFAGPGIEHHNYIKLIYARGFSLIKLYRINIEKEFSLIYFKKLKPILKQKIEKFKQSGRKDYKFVFTGYTLGGSLATLAAFDFAKKEIIKHPIVYTFGSLRIGDATFVALVNTTIRVWRIVKSDDYIVRIPNCYYSTSFKVWRCFSQPIIKKFVSIKTFPLKLYVNNYLKLYNRNNPALKKALVNAEKQKIRKPQIPKKINYNKTEKKLKTTSKRSKKSDENKLFKKKSSIIANSRKRKISTRPNKKKMIKGQIEPKNDQKVLKRISNIKVKGKILLKKLKKIPSKRIDNKIYNKKIKVRKAIMKSRNLAEKLLKNLNRSMEELDNKKQKEPLKEIKEKEEWKKSPQPKEDPKNITKNDINLTKENKEVFKPVTKNSPIKKIQSNPTKKINQPIIKFKPFIPEIHTINTIQTYTPIQTYFKFIYYSQPIGYQIFYDTNMLSYKVCEYVEGIANCEKFISLPTSFSVESHNIYYNIKFDSCSNINEL